MKRHEVKQGDTDWLIARMGMPTASRFDDIMTPGGKLSASSTGYMHELLSELILGEPSQKTRTSWMERGTEMEAEAVGFYELEAKCETEPIGFITNDEETIGASPDRMVVGANIGVEIKCHKPEVHVGLLMEHPIADKHKVQIQGQILVCELECVDIVGYCPRMPTAIHRVYRDEEYLAKLARALSAFVDNLQAAIGYFREQGFIHDAVAPAETADPLGISEAELEAWLADKFPDHQERTA